MKFNDWIKKQQKNNIRLGLDHEGIDVKKIIRYLKGNQHPKAKEVLAECEASLAEAKAKGFKGSFCPFAVYETDYYDFQNREGVGAVK
jgi:hypothetical protein